VAKVLGLEEEPADLPDFEVFDLEEELADLPDFLELDDPAAYAGAMLLRSKDTLTTKDKNLCIGFLTKKTLPLL
jgi:hypothetical protein